MFIHPTAIIYPNVTIEEDVYIGAFCIIGASPEHLLHFGKDTNKGVTIRKGAIIHGHATIDQGIERNTEIGEGAFIMKAVHVGHDSIIGKNVIVSPHVVVGGHVVIGKDSNIGMGCIIHQRKTIPNHCRIGMGSVVTKTSELWSDGIFVGYPAHYLKPFK